ncbi:MAG: hypothetical protein HY815_19845 [Candidatus Riflebacteria bacterium]|nr:hypothetical protein [Candidatus Riflebacteria bacterium]
MNFWGLVVLCAYLWAVGASPRTRSLLVLLGLFTVWTETALLEQRIGLLTRWLDRRSRVDDPVPFWGALAGLLLVAALGLTRGELTGVTIPAGLALGAFVTTVTRCLDWRRGVLGAVLVVYNGTGGTVLRFALTLSVGVLVLTG